MISKLASTLFEAQEPMTVYHLKKIGWIAVPTNFGAEKLQVTGHNLASLADQQIAHREKFADGDTTRQLFQLDLDREVRMFLAVAPSAVVKLTIQLSQALSVTVSYGATGLEVESSGERRQFLTGAPSDLPTLLDFAGRAFGAAAERTPAEL